MRAEYHVLTLRWLSRAEHPNPTQGRAHISFRISDERELYALRAMGSELTETVDGAVEIARFTKTEATHLARHHWSQSRYSRPEGVEGVGGYMCYIRRGGTGDFHWSFSPFFPELPAEVCEYGREDFWKAFPGRLLREMVERERPFTPVITRIVRHGHVLEVPLRVQAASGK